MPRSRTTPSKSPYVREVVLRRDEVASFESYPYSLPAVAGLHKLPLHPQVTFLIGENGSGKSTLLEAIAVAWGLNPEGGSRNFHFSTRESHSGLAEHLTLVREPGRPDDSFFLRAESFFNVATEIEQLDEGSGEILGSYGGLSLHEQSHGESFISLLTRRFGGHGLYFLDEPEAALSPTRQMAALVRIHQLVRNHSQFLIATHSPILMAYPNALILELTASGIHQIDYEQTEHYAITREFLNNRQRMLAELLK